MNQVESKATETQPEAGIVRGIGIVRLNQYEWWAAKSIEEARLASAQRFGISESEVLDELYPARFVSDTEIWKEYVSTDDGLVPFAIELSRRVANETIFPHLFAMTN